MRINSLSLLACCLVVSACGVPVGADQVDRQALGGANQPPVPHRVHPYQRNRPINTAPNCTLRYYGGGVLSQVHVIDVLWGSGLDSTVTQKMGPFYSAVTDSTYMDWLSEYNTYGATTVDGRPGSNQGITRGTFGGTYTIVPSRCASVPGTCTDSDVSSEILDQIAAGTLPGPTFGCDGEVNSLYMVQFPQGIDIDDGTGAMSCSSFCAYHSTVSDNSGTPIAYGIIPWMGPGSACETGCGSSVYLDRLTSTVAHELVEAVTDRDIGLTQGVTRPMAWYANGNNCGEIGDICNTDGTIVDQNGTTWTVQTQWSNAAHACVATRSIAPSCTSANASHFCQCLADGGIVIPPPPGDAGVTDGGQVTVDAGVPDAGPVVVDAGHDADAGSTSDAGMNVEPDDAGTIGTADAGTGGGKGTGCGCQSATDTAWLLAPLALVWFSRRRR
jgi:MYXO-CTERM domain-containing protein